MGTRQLQGLQCKYEAAIRGARQLQWVQSMYGARGMRQLQGV